MSKKITYPEFKVTEIQGRYLTNNHLQAFLSRLDPSFNLKVLGTSEKDKPIYGLTMGSGARRILMWSQMHGNEATTTKAVLDLINYLKLELGESKIILKNCTLHIIPILNPDGAEAYTRVNANGIDLNRDAQEQSQKESKILRTAYDDFQPDYCFNLHDQRTIFNVGETEKPATVSFLAPAFDIDRNVSESREKSMQVIDAMNQKLQQHIPGQIGRYDDSFNSNCVGDAFQMLQTPTILFEAGHFPKDYQRETTREYLYMALMEALNTISNGDFKKCTVTDYLAIPENRKMLYDVLITNVQILDAALKPDAKAGILFQERLEGQHIVFRPIIELLGETEKVLFGHEVKDASNRKDRLWLEKHGILALFS